MNKLIYEQIMLDSLIYGMCSYQILDKPPYLQNVTKDILKSEHHVYNAPMSGIYQIEDELVTLPAGTVIDFKKLTRAETWDSLYNPDYKTRVLGDFKIECKHEYLSYQGYNDSFEYCKHCDQKKKLT